ncbi:TonB-dependent receptor [Marinigracilibium pacificum]|uniref:TonB-dependent receptor n=1 Tax=Marinigracilibium pacificum TaxID=2729599 RepID=A0A848J5G2_9BACT|nr:TonB-dependent receptor [Marinigracilibium pacificum]NMM49599.1 TonB-dependent receptor [Marinigracilibium pacificum]
MKAVFAITTFIFSFWFVFGQSENSKISHDLELKQFLAELEVNYQVRFSFIDSVVVNKSISRFDISESSLPDVLSNLERMTNLKFVLINTENVIIRHFKPYDKVNVCGYLIDEHGRAVSNATVSVNSSQSAIQSDNQGYFINRVRYGEYLEISHIGFATRKILASELLGTSCPNVKLSEKIKELPEVVLSDFLVGGMSKVNTKTKLKPSELGILPGLIEPDILKGIQQLPGVSGPFETASGVYVHGTSPDMNLVTWNGIKTYNQSHFFGMLSAFNPFVIDRVEFVKNGVSPEYGDRISGVVDIRSGEEVNNEFDGGAGFNMLYGDAYLKIPIIKDKISVNISGRRSFNDQLETFTYKSYSDRVFQNTKINEDPSQGVQDFDNDFYFTDFTTGINYQLDDRNKINFNSLYTKNDLLYRSSNQNIDYSDLLKTENEGYNINWNYKGSDLELEIEAYYTGYLLNYKFERTLASSSETSFKDNSVDDFGLNSFVLFDINKRSQIKTGYQYSNKQVQYEFKNSGPGYTLILDQSDEKLNTHSLFSDYQLKANKSTLSAGLRINYYSEMGKTYFEPRLSAEHNLIGDLFLSGTAEYRTQTVSQIRESVVSDLSLENKVWSMASNEGFPVIESYQYSLGLAYDDNGWLLDVEGYYRDIKNVTTLTFGFLNPVDNNFRIGNSVVKGADFLLKKQVGNFRSWASYSYLFSENKFKGLNDNKPFPGNWNIEHTLKWIAYYKFKSLQFSLGWTWHTGKTFTNVKVIDTTNGPLKIEYGELNANNLPVYHRMDLSVIYDFKPNPDKDIRYRFGVSILNVYDHQNLLNREFRTTPGVNNELIDNRIYGLGITPNLTFRVFW